MVDDTELLEAWRGGDRAAGEVLCQRYFKLVQRFFYARRGGDVDDMVQQTFEACVKGRDRVREGSSFRAYVFGVAYNVMRVDRRQRRDTVPVVEDGAGSVRSAAPGPTTWMGAREDAERLAQGLRRLPIDLRTVLELHYFEGLSALDIARIVVLPEGTVRSRLRRGRRQLRMVMGEPLPGDGPMQTERDIEGDENTEDTQSTENDTAHLGQTFESETT